MIGLDIVYCVTAGKAMQYVYQQTCNGYRTHTCTPFGLSAWISIFAIIQMFLSMVCHLLALFMHRMHITRLLSVCIVGAPLLRHSRHPWSCCTVSIWQCPCPCSSVVCLALLSWHQQVSTLCNCLLPFADAAATPATSRCKLDTQTDCLACALPCTVCSKLRPISSIVCEETQHSVGPFITAV